MQRQLEQYIPIAQMLAKTFGEDCEVVIHDLSIPRNSVVYTINSHVTGRQVGQSFDHLVPQVLLAKDFTGYSANYYFHTTDGRLIRSSTVLLRDTDRQVIGALCINLDTTVITQGVERLMAMLPGYPAAGSGIAAEPESASIDHIAGIVDSLIGRIVGNKAPAGLKREEKLELIRFMEQKGIFLLKGAVDKVAIKMGISKVTVYSYLDEVKKSG